MQTRTILKYRIYQLIDGSLAECYTLDGGTRRKFFSDDFPTLSDAYKNIVRWIDVPPGLRLFPEGLWII